nr:hypothetical protein [Methylosinus sp. KRF6]
MSLLQGRHGSFNIHKMPAGHIGDLGIDFYCTGEAVIYQCFAVEEPVDISKRAKRQKEKITTDLGKLIKNSNEISKLFIGVPVRNWILLVPIHDSKDVNLHCSKKTSDLRNLKLSHLDENFEVSIQDQSSFPAGTVGAAISALTNVSLRVEPPTPEELESWQAGSPNLLANATKKLGKRTGVGKEQAAVSAAVESFLKGNALIDELRSSAPDLHERVAGAITRHARRLSLAGPSGGPAPSAILHSESESLIGAIKDAAPSLSTENAYEIAWGAISDWVMRCSLDFP